LKNVISKQGLSRSTLVGTAQGFLRIRFINPSKAKPAFLPLLTFKILFLKIREIQKALDGQSKTMTISSIQHLTSSRDSRGLSIAIDGRNPTDSPSILKYLKFDFYNIILITHLIKNSILFIILTKV
jgi:hypothetical protein